MSLKSNGKRQLDFTDVWWLRDQMKPWISVDVSDHMILESLKETSVSEKLYLKTK